VQHQQFRISVISGVPEIKMRRSIHGWKAYEILYNFLSDFIFIF
jgi:hypothetical protein